jgi:hypothetical protein
MVAKSSLFQPSMTERKGALSDGGVPAPPSLYKFFLFPHIILIFLYVVIGL